MSSTTTDGIYHHSDDAVWFITGCSSGIGKALSQLIASKGHRVVSTARKLSALSYLPDDKPNVLKLQLDVTMQHSVDEAIAATLHRFGRIDVVVNNAGYTLYGDAENAAEEDSRQVFETNFWGMVRTMKHALSIFRDENPKTGQQGGVVLNVSSLGGRVAFAGNSFYHATKFAMEGFTESISREVRPDWNMHFCLIEPGGVDTNYATTSTQHIAPHPAYAAKDTPARVLEGFIENDEVRKGWATAEEVAGAMYTIVTREQKMPLRLPLSHDSWNLLKGAAVQAVEALDEVKDISLSVGNKDQWAAIKRLLSV